MELMVLHMINQLKFSEVKIVEFSERLSIVKD